VTASEFAFLALGLVLGVGVGAAIIEVLRARPPARREIRVTVAPNSIPARRSATLADPHPVDTAGPARGGPADRREFDRQNDDGEADDHFATAPSSPLSTPPDRTDVPNPAASGAFRLQPLTPAVATAISGPPTSVGIPVATGSDPMLDAIGASRRREEAAEPILAASGRRGKATRPPPAILGAVDAGTGGGASDNVSRSTSQGEAEAAAASETMGSPAPVVSDEPDTTDPCADQRRVADERCAVAARARTGAQEAMDALRAAQRAYDDHLREADAAIAAADPRAVRDAKEAAQHAFRESRSVAQTREEVEAAARDWLTKINEINQQTRDASGRAERHRTASTGLVVELERLSVEADAARISAESAEEACIGAREAVAVCQEGAARATAALREAVAVGRPTSPQHAPFAGLADDDDAAMASRAGDDAPIIRLLRGDHDVMGRIVARLGGDDPEERRRWQNAIGGLLEALVGRSIEAAAFDFPADHPFWGMFTRDQCRDIAAALASLGYRHDGFGGWADDRVPSQRDLSLATGYAGLDPMRVRHWPTESEMQDLMRGVTVAADEYIWEAAGTLTLGELVSLLGRRADALTDLWNDWGTVRPLLLAAD
jgi:hypothetical protein